MGKLFVVGVGSGVYEDLTIRADRILKNSDLIYCDEKLYQALMTHFDPEKIISNSYNATRERCMNAIKSVMQDKNVSIVGSGDTGIYGISSIMIQLVEKFCPDIDIEIIPGITSFISGAAILGSPLTKDFAIISLSDNFNEQEKTKERIEAVAKTNFGIVFYSPHNSTYHNLLMAREIILKYRSSETLIGIVKNIGSNDQRVTITNLSEIDINDIDSLTTIFIGRDDTRVAHIKIKKMVTSLY